MTNPSTASANSMRHLLIAVIGGNHLIAALNQHFVAKVSSNLEALLVFSSGFEYL